MLFKLKGSLRQKFVFLVPGARDTWRHEDATSGNKWDHSVVAIWHAMHALFVTSGSQRWTFDFPFYWNN